MKKIATARATLCVSRTIAGLCGCYAICVSYNAIAVKNYPGKPVRLLVPFVAGGGADVIGRALAQQMTRSLGKAVVVDNRSGAGGRIAAELVANAAPDGHTLLLGTHTTLVFAPALYHNLSYNPAKDFAPIALFAQASYVLVVHPSVKVASVGELVALAKSRIKPLKYASSGEGGPAHLGAELLNYSVGMRTLHIPYKGSAPGTFAVSSGEVDMMFSNVLPALPLIKSDRLRALAISTLQRNRSLPEVPTVNESGVPGFEMYIFFGLVGPAGVPRPVLEKLEAAVISARALPDVREKIYADGGGVMTGNSQEFARTIKNELGKWSKIIGDAGVRGE